MQAFDLSYRQEFDSGRGLRQRIYKTSGNNENLINFFFDEQISSKRGDCRRFGKQRNISVLEFSHQVAAGTRYELRGASSCRDEQSCWRIQLCSEAKHVCV